MKRRAPTLAFLLAFAACALAAQASDPRTTGVVLLHGWGLRSHDDGSRPNPLADHWLLAKTLRDAGHPVAEAEMAWGPNRLLDVTREHAMLEVDALAATLRAQGARRIVVAGYSMGAAMALAYAAEREVAGVVALAPASHPELGPALFPDVIPAQVRKARDAIAAGKADERTTFTGINCCYFVREFATTPRIYLSYFAPDGPATMAASASRLSRGASALLVYGRDDAAFAMFQRINVDYASYLWQRLPPRPHHRRIIVDAHHGDVPSRAAHEVATWIAALP